MPCLLCTWGMDSCTAYLQAGAILHLTEVCAWGIATHMECCSGLPVAAKQYTCMPASRGSACSALLPVEARQYCSLADLQQVQHTPEP